MFLKCCLCKASAILEAFKRWQVRKKTSFRVLNWASKKQPREEKSTFKFQTGPNEKSTFENSRAANFCSFVFPSSAEANKKTVTKRAQPSFSYSFVQTMSYICSENFSWGEEKEFFFVASNRSHATSERGTKNWLRCFNFRHRELPCVTNPDLEKHNSNSVVYVTREGFARS